MSFVLVVIPARYASSRYPGKPLALLKGPDGEKTLIRRSWEAAMAARGVDRVVVATDDERIRREAESFGAEVVMTSPDCANGSERCADVLERRPDLASADVVINLQGDSPLTPPWFVEALIEAMRADPSLQTATPVLRCEPETLAHFLEDRRAGRVGGTTAVFGRSGDALYFSKEVIPYTGRTFATGESTPVFHHVGLYAYRPAALKAYARLTPGPLEALEGLEQLRFLENGLPMRCVEVEGRGRVFWELNNPVDVERIESVLARIGGS